MRDPSLAAGTRSPLLWGAYLACSWTWCIGMFLPILLLRDMGWPGYWIFAVPNVVGAAAMGWVIKTRSDSVKFVEKHARAIWWFSAVTLAFHLYWIFWLAHLIRSALGISGGYMALSMGIVVVFALISRSTIRRGKAPQTALVLLVLSLSVLVGAFSTSDLQAAQLSLITASQQSLAPLWMLPVMLFGFLLCPYLDITFHHARQQLDSQKNGRLGFTIGFVGFFFFMILLTTRYAGLFSGSVDGAEAALISSPWLAVGILLHILCQWVFTVRVHFNRIQTLPDAEPKKALLIVLLVLAGIAGISAPWLPAYAGLLGGEVVYRLFMSAYGLFFPSYMLYQVIARRKGTAGGQSFMWIAILLALPLFWMGFIERQPIWLLPGMGLILSGAMIQRARRV